MNLDLTTLARRAGAATLAVAAASTLAVGVAEAAPTGKVVAQTQKMTGPSLKTTQVGWYPAGTVLALQCYERGQSVTGALSKYHPNGGWDDLWYKTSDGHFVADIDINTGSNNPITGKCGESAPGPVGGLGEAAVAVIDAKPGKAIAWANSQVGSQAYDFACQRFVENAYGTSGRYSSAIAMRNQLAATGQIHMDRNIPAGALVFSRNTKYDLGYGHVVIATGSGQYVSGGVSKSYGSRATVQRLTTWNPGPGSEYLGWALAPAGWPGR